MIRPFALFALLSLVLGGCAPAEDDVASGPPPTVVATPSPTTLVDDLGDFAPPDFEAGGIAINSTAKRVPVYSHPDRAAEPIMKLKSRNPAGQQLNFLVLSSMKGIDGTGWFEILLPERPNGSEGWVEYDSDIEVVYVDERIEVDLSDYELRYYKKGRLVERFEVAIGQDRYPTPTGAYYVWAHIPQPEPGGPYGTLALGLSGFSPVLSDWAGGGRAAIHGTADPADKGAKVSHGCVRVFNDDMNKLKDIRLGTPVLISP
jgi:hypothetical protein